MVVKLMQAGRNDPRLMTHPNQTRSELLWESPQSSSGNTQVAVLLGRHPWERFSVGDQEKEAQM